MLQDLIMGDVVIQGFPGGSDGKEFACNSGNLGLIPQPGRYPGEGNGTLLQSWLENSVNRGAWPGGLRSMGWPRVGHNLIRSKGSGGFPDSSVSKASVCDAGDPGSNPGLGGSGGEVTGYPLQYSWASLVAQLVKNLPAMWETWVRSLGWEEPLEKGKATHSSILAWRIP